MKSTIVLSTYCRPAGTLLRFGGTLLGFGGALLGLAAVLLGLAGCTGDEPPADRPNVLLVVIDTLRADHAGCYGYERPTTPRLDDLAREGILFENTLSQAAFTLPSMATLFTSLDPMSHGVRRHPDGKTGRIDALPEALLTLPERFEAEGYDTAAVISNSLFQSRFKAGFDAGFDFYEVGRGRRDAARTTDEAIAWLEGRGDRREPFFFWVHYIDPHWPYDPPKDFERPFTHADGGQFDRLLKEFFRTLRAGGGPLGGGAGTGMPREIIAFDPPVDADGLAAGIAAYDSEVAFADAQMGRLLDHLRARGLDGNTIVAVVSDHGEALGEHGLTFSHNFTLYEEMQRVVQVIRPPGGLERPVRIAKQVRLLDFTPTILAMAGLPALAGAEGRDLSPLWREGEGSLPEAPAYAESDVWPERVPGARYGDLARRLPRGNAGKWKMVRFRDHKLIWIPGNGWELYDLAADPGETRNLWDEKPAAAGPMTDILREYTTRSAERGESRPSSLGPDLNSDTREELDAVLREMGYMN